MGEGIAVRIGVKGLVVLLWVGILAGGLFAQERPKVQCRPPGDEAGRARAAAIKLDALADIAKGEVSFETKIQRIRAISPEGSTFDIIAFRLCEAYRNGLITREFYEQYLLARLAPEGGVRAGRWNLSGDVYVMGKKTERLTDVEIELGFEPPRVTTTAPDGTFSFPMKQEDADRAIVLRARKPGYQMHVQRIRLNPQMSALSIPLTPAVESFTVGGRIGDEEGQRPLEQARVALGTEPPLETVTRSDGAFRFDVGRDYLEKFVSVKVDRRGYRPHVQEFKLEDGMKPVVILLRRAAFPVSGRIRAKGTGEDLEGVVVTLQVEPRVQTVSRSNGAFRLLVPDVHEGGFATLRAEKEGYKPYTLDIELRKEGGDPIELEMSPAQ